MDSKKCFFLQFIARDRDIPRKREKEKKEKERKERDREKKQKDIERDSIASKKMFFVNFILTNI